MTVASNITPARVGLASIFKRLWENIISGGIAVTDPRAADHLFMRRMRVLNGASAGVIACALFLVGITSFFGLQDLRLPLLLAAVVQALTMGFARSGRIVPAAHVQLITLLLIVTYCAWQTGGARSPSIVFYVGLPLHAIFVIGRNAGVAYVSVVAAVLTAFGVCNLFGVTFPNIVPPEAVVSVYLWYVMVMGAVILSPASAFLLAQKEAEEKLLAANAELESANAELARSRDIAEAATRAKSTFLATVSHEMRTPMNGIIGMTQLLLHTALNNSQRDYTETIRSSSDALLAVISDVLDFSKIEAGKLDVECIDMDLHSLLEEVGSIMAFHAAAKNLELIIDIEPALPRLIKGDPQRVRQCVLNLVSNAIKFTHSGEVVVSAQFASRVDGAPLLRVEVRDTGAGIAPEVLSRLFQPFVQADSSTTRQFGGTGLGLSIVSRLVDLMGGQVQARSELHHGSAFWFTLPFTEVTGSRTPERLASRHSRVLVVDDNASVRRMLVGRLEHTGFEVTQVAEASAALASMRGAVLEGRPFAVVITDIHMPGMTGIELSQQIRAHSELSAAHVVMLTSVAAPSDLACLGGGSAAYYLPKPVRAGELISCLERILSPAEPERQVESQRHISRAKLAATAFPQYASKVLLIEDNQVNQKVAQRLLERLGCQVVIAGDGAAGVAKYQSEPFQLVLMDIQMPVMDGYTAAARIREIDAGQRRTPIVALTADALSDQLERCVKAGMDDCLTKPLDINRLREVCDRFLGDPSISAPVPQEQAASGG